MNEILYRRGNRTDDGITMMKIAGTICIYSGEEFPLLKK